jgi:hypothetical protein
VLRAESTKRVDDCVEIGDEGGAIVEICVSPGSLAIAGPAVFAAAYSFAVPIGEPQIAINAERGPLLVAGGSVKTNCGDLTISKARGYSAVRLCRLTVHLKSDRGALFGRGSGVLRRASRRALQCGQRACVEQ